MSDTRKKTVVIVTGLSGAGRSTALKALEDSGFETFDNTPIAGIPALIQQDDLGHTPIAFGVDTRTRGFRADDVATLFADLQKDQRLDSHLLFLTADETVLQRRYSESRRRHPMAIDRPVESGIKSEMELMMPLRSLAEVIDTSDMSVHDLSRQVKDMVKEARAPMTINLISFGYKYGAPRQADIMFDARFMKNPHWNEKLRHMLGTEEAIQEYVRSDANYKSSLDALTNLIVPLLPRYKEEGKSYLTVAIGCTGGRHRSITLIEDLKKRLEGDGRLVFVQHRDMDR